ncbi:serine/threonine-protein kinase [Aporhodopirellula aestuarii]|uniref:Serine/threonine protein kinase n=1 Tax=Aporhodopirellula aestuarii TaxID=2950107 RepID=A0ABT0U612_9BACT|nr:serine/threonine-protein kinase [Aporhodopirellula aestuarii]MCM2372359.1 serine/threonine protein kinase [Aporhodopirellula aestuarii]
MDAPPRSSPDAIDPGDNCESLDEIMLTSLEALAESEYSDSPAALLAFLPETDPESRHFVLVELIKLHMTMAMDSGIPRPLDDYYAALPDLISPATTPLDLVMEEIQLQRECGREPEFNAFAQRYPQFADSLAPLLGVCETSMPREQTQPPEPIKSGTSVDDFEIIQLLGKGAFAHVYLARQISMTRLVALKVSRWKKVADANDGESRALSQFDHPNIIRVFDQRFLNEPPLHLLYMQFHPGGTLADVITKVKATHRNQLRGKLLLRSVDENLLASAQVVPDNSVVREWIHDAEWPKLVAWVGIQLAHALQTAHDSGVLHRDVKPANVLLTAEGTPQLADFNVSLAGAAGRAGAACSLGGSVGYMSPEHLRAITANLMAPKEDVRERADLYSLAVLLWELWQGQRPFNCASSASSWSQAVSNQLDARSEELKSPARDNTASQRVLESVLRKSLSFDPALRPSSGSEMAASLRLALYPEAAELFEPNQRSWTAWLMRRSPWWVTIVVILLPNMAAGRFHFLYNMNEIMTPETQQGLVRLSYQINLTFFPIAALLVIVLTRAPVRALRTAYAGHAVDHSDLNATLQLGHLAALISGGCWIFAGVLMPYLLGQRFPGFTTSQSIHLFASSLICGGVAMIYPFFSLGLICAGAYYPKMIRPTMQDPDFDRNAARVISQSESYLLIAALIPLVGAALLIFSESQSRRFMLIAIVAGMIGLLASFIAYRKIVQMWRRLAEVLSASGATVPGDRRGNSAASQSRT